MVTPSENQLHDMGLTPGELADKSPGWGGWTRKLDVHTAVQASDQPDKPVGNPLWKTAKEAPASNMISCNMGIHAVRFTGIVTGGNSDGSDKVLDEQTYLCKKETALWTSNI